MSHRAPRWSRWPRILCIALVGLLATASFAQDPDDSDADQGPGEGVEEIFVTITKTTESLQEVSASITALSPERIEQANIENIADVVQLIPNALVKGDGTGGGITMRGISTSFTGQSPVAQHMNGVFRFDGVDGTYLGQYYDIQRLEVARGPSGTVYGRNATAGALNLVWNEPHSEWELFGDYTQGNFDLYQLRGGVNIPILGAGDERLMGRFVFTSEKHDGYQDNLEESSRNKDPAGADDLMLRGTLKSVITDDLTLSLRGFWSRTKQLNTISRPLDDSFQSGALVLGTTVISPFNSFVGAKPIPSNPRDVRSRLWDDRLRPKLVTSGADGTLEYSLPELPLLGSLDFTILGGWERQKLDRASDADGSELAVLDNLDIQHRTNYTGELRFASNNGGLFDWIGGVFYFRREATQILDTGTPVGFIVNDIRDEDRGWAPFLSGTFRPHDDVELFGGVRWNWDERWRDAFSDGILGQGIVDAVIKERFRERTGELGAKWFWSEGKMLYAKWGRGYKPGGFNNDASVFFPEVVKAWEVGAKNSFFDRRLQLNLTAFQYSYTDLQVPQLLGTEIKTLNAAEATIQGIELELVARPVPEWTVVLSAGYLDATFDKFCADDGRVFVTPDEPGCERPPNIPAQGLGGRADQSGNHLEDSPTFSLSLLTDYRLELGSYGSLNPVLEFNYTEEYFLRPFNLDVDKVDDNTRTDLRLIWRSPTERYSVEVFGENLEDETTYARTVVGPEFSGAVASGFGILQPRTYGVRVGYRLGGPPGN